MSESTFCPHCSCALSKKTYSAHRRLYYDEDTDQWLKRREVECDFEDQDDYDLGAFDVNSSSVSCMEEHRNVAPPIVDFVESDDSFMGDDDDDTSGSHSHQSFGDGDHRSDDECTNGCESDEIEVIEEDDVEDDLFSSSSDTDTSPSAVILWLIYFIVALQKKHYIPDIAVSILLKFLAAFFKVIGLCFPQTIDTFRNFPYSHYHLRKVVGTNEEKFKRYVVCSKCYALYSLDDCIQTSGCRQVATCCSDSRCKNALLRSIQARCKVILYPKKVYCYMPLITSLKDFMKRPGFYELCQHWRNLTMKNGVYRDIYDGKIWNEFQVYEGESFLADPFSIAIIMNIDWFKPYKHLEYKIGAIYITVMNLPRHLRYKQENCILLGLIPGPSEPSISINTFLRPFVKELLELWDGVEMKIHSISEPKVIRCALLCVACDVPAARKVCGFLGHSATVGCSKCLKEFPGSVGNKDYSGFDRTLWPPRTNSLHRQHTAEIRRSKTKADCLKLESKYGCRYSVLLKLPYFDAVRMTIIDPMHNLFLGTAKRMMKCWNDRDYVASKDFAHIQACVDTISVPSHIGRIPYKIASSFSGFTADQFKNWTNLFSLFSLHDLLPTDHLECWRHFVLAARILCQKVVTDVELKLADALLLRFCHRVENLYGKEFVTPNMHLHCHLIQCIADYGPSHSFWLYAFERYNGILEHFPTNHRSVEIQLMRRFINESHIVGCESQLPEEYKSHFSSLLESILSPSLAGSLLNTEMSHAPLRLINPSQIDKWTLDTLTNSLSLPQSYILSALSESELAELKLLYHQLYPSIPSEQINLQTTFRKYASLNYKGYQYHTLLSMPMQKQSIVFGIYCIKNNSSGNFELSYRPVLLHYFVYHTYYVNEIMYLHVLVRISWLKPHHAKDYFGKPLEIWWEDLFDYNIETVFNHFIPVQMLLCHSASMTIKYEHQSVLLICPTENVLKY